MKYYYLLLILLLIPFVKAETQDLGTFKQNTCITLKQLCADCTYVNITTVLYPNSSQLVINKGMTKNNYDYNYTFCNTGQLGNYIYNTIGNPLGIATVQPVSFMITPSGNKNVLGFYFIVIAIIYAIAFIGFFGRNEWISILGGLAMISLGLYTILSGIDIYRNSITEVFSWITIGIGAIFALTAGVEIIKENL